MKIERKYVVEEVNLLVELGLWDKYSDGGVEILRDWLGMESYETFGYWWVRKGYSGDGEELNKLFLDNGVPNGSEVVILMEDC